MKQFINFGGNIINVNTINHITFVGYDIDREQYGIKLYHGNNGGCITEWYNVKEVAILNFNSLLRHLCENIPEREFLMV